MKPDYSTALAAITHLCELHTQAEKITELTTSLMHCPSWADEHTELMTACSQIRPLTDWVLGHDDDKLAQALLEQAERLSTLRNLLQSGVALVEGLLAEVTHEPAAVERATVWLDAVIEATPAL